MSPDVVQVLDDAALALWLSLFVFLAVRKWRLERDRRSRPHLRLVREELEP